jgi:TIR domain
LARCDFFVLVLSPAAVRSIWVKRELLYALNDRRYEERIVPILYRACDYSRLSWTLGGLQMVDFRARYKGGCIDLLRIWGIGYVG